MFYVSFLNKIWIHTVFHTKDSEPLLKNDFINLIIEHIHRHLENQLDCKVRIINGVKDHLHILFLLSPNYSIKDILHNIKGESSHWINQNNFLNVKFAWQTGYGAFSVSESMVNEVERYVRNQEEHHKKITFGEEYALFMKKYGFSADTQQ